VMRLSRPLKPLNPRVLKSSRDPAAGPANVDASSQLRSSPDSALEEAGFEPSVPPDRSS
jgi:hypothetical protein